MDFASLMSKEISKAKSSTPTPTPTSTPTPAPEETKTPESNASKYLRRSELEAARLAEYNAEQERIQREREEKFDRKRKFEEEEAERNAEREEKRRRLAEESRRKREEQEARLERERRKRLGLPEVPVGEGDSKEGTPLGGEEDVSPEDVIAKLRERDEPVRLFGESEKGRSRRYRRLIQRENTPQKKLSDGPIPTTLELVPESQMKVPDKVPTDEEGLKYLFRQLASYFTMVLREWELALAKREDAVKQSTQGKQAYNAMVQSRENMKPLFRLFENGQIEKGILDPIVDIVRHAQKRRYVDANDGYLTLSIGKA